MTRAIQVRLGNAERLIGTLRYNREGARESAAFEYDPSWLADAERFSIDPALQLVAGPQFRRRSPHGSIFHAAIADTEPDGWARRVIMRDHAKRRADARRAGVDMAPLLGALDFLLEVDDVSRVGALRLRDESGVFRRAHEPGGRGVPPLVELRDLLAATRAVETNSETAADLAYRAAGALRWAGCGPSARSWTRTASSPLAGFPAWRTSGPLPRARCSPCG